VAGSAALVGVAPDAAPGEYRPVGAWDGNGGTLPRGLHPWLLTIAPLGLGKASVGGAPLGLRRW
jgi:hypothetical protein